MFVPGEDPRMEAATPSTAPVDVASQSHEGWDAGLLATKITRCEDARWGGSQEHQWAWAGSNCRPYPYQGYALAN